MARGSLKANKAVIEKEMEIEKTIEEYDKLKEEKAKKKRLTVNDLQIYDIMFNAYYDKLENLETELIELNNIKDIETKKYIDSKKDVAVLEKLKEKKVEEYKEELSKQEERELEPFVSHKYAMGII